MPPRLQLRFAAGALEDGLTGRTASEGNPSHTAHRDLARYYQLLRDELTRVALSETEATLVVAAARGWLVEPTGYRYLWIEVEDYLADQVEDTGVAALDVVPRLAAAGRATLVAKLRALSPGAQLALCDAVERYWLRSTEARDRAALDLPQDQHAALLREVGLVRDPALRG